MSLISKQNSSIPSETTQNSNSYTTPASRWVAVSTRDPNADGSFVYLVRTTKIYCRPTCKARLARRANVDFCSLPSEAEAAGFRACKRCRPELVGVGMPEDAAVTKVRQLVLDGLDDGKMENLDDMARRVGLSKWHFHRVFKKVIGITPVEYARLWQISLVDDGESPSSKPFWTTPRLPVESGADDYERP